MRTDPFRILRSLVFTMAIVVVVVFAAPAAVWAGHAVISLLPSCSVESGEVLIAHVARVDTTDAILKERIESLDIIEAPAKGRSAEVSSKLIELRLRLAGIDLRNVSIRGSQSEVIGLGGLPVRTIDQPDSPSGSKVPVLATAFAPNPARRSPETPERDVPRTPHDRAQDDDATDESQTLEDRVLSTARRAILNVLPWSKDDVNFRLAQPITREAKLAESTGKCTCTAQLRSSSAPVGRVNVDVTVTYTDQSPVDIAVAFDVRHYETVVATARPIGRGRTIQKEDLYLHRWDVTGATDYCTSSELVIGRVASRTLPALQIVKDQDIERGLSSQPGQDRPVVIKRQDRVKLTAKIGDLNITVRGEAMQDGRVGETIRVQNSESKTIVQGRVLSSDEVEIAY